MAEFMPPGTGASTAKRGEYPGAWAGAGGLAKRGRSQGAYRAGDPCGCGPKPGVSLSECLLNTTFHLCMLLLLLLAVLIQIGIVFWLLKKGTPFSDKR